MQIPSVLPESTDKMQYLHITTGTFHQQNHSYVGGICKKLCGEPLVDVASQHERKGGGI